MIIRKAKLHDLEHILRIYNYEVLHGTATFDINPRSMEDWKEWFESHNKDNHPLIVAEIDEKAVGYASLSAYRPKEAYAKTVELSVYIDVEYRNRKIAGRLIECILKEAASREDIHTVISVITGGNEASIKLHQKFGFVYTGTLKEVGMKFGCLLDIEHYQLIV